AGPKETRCWPVTNSAACGAYRLNVTATRVAGSGAYAGEMRAYAFSVVGSPYQQTWSQVNLGANNWTSIASSADGSRLIVGGAQTYLSTNSGATWNLVQYNQQIVACSGNG